MRTSPEEHIEHYQCVTISACPLDLQQEKLDLSPIHCESNARIVADALESKGIHARVILGLARLPYSKRVNDPERWRVHAWVESNGRYFDPTYEFTWKDSEMNQDEVVYFKSLITKDTSNSGSALDATRSQARALGIDAVLDFDGEAFPTAEISLRKVIDGKERLEKEVRATHWKEITNILDTMNLQSMKCVITLHWDDKRSRQFMIVSGQHGFVLQDTDTSCNHSDSWSVLCGTRSDVNTVEFIYRSKHWLIPKKHVINQAELKPSLESVFRGWHRLESWDIVDGYFVE